jgi:Tfp pilus assembly protein PilZ
MIGDEFIVGVKIVDQEEKLRVMVRRQWIYV